MKILKIRFENIHSFATTVDIDFEKEPLASAQLFAIVGPTGAGKTTILDVITLAIYGRTPRMADINKGKVETYGSVISRGTNKAWAEVTYQTAKGRFISRWLLERNRKGKLKEVEMELIQADTMQALAGKVREVKQKNEEIIGLDYSQFVKSVVLAQGEFSKFLKSDSDDRLKLLEKITGDSIYRDISRRAFDIANNKKKEIELLEQRLEAVDLLSDEQIEQLEQAKSDLSNKYNVLTEEKQKILALKELKQNIDDLQKKLIDAAEEKRKILLDKKNLEQDFARLEKFKNLQSKGRELSNWQKYKEILSDLDRKINQLQQDKTHLLEQRQQLVIAKKKADEKLKNLEVRLQEKQPILQKVRQLDNLLIEQKTQLEQKDKNLQEFKKQYLTLKSENSQITSLLAKLKLQQTKLQFYLTENEKLAQLENSLERLKVLAENYDIEFDKIKAFIKEKGYNVGDKITEIRDFFVVEIEKNAKELSQLKGEANTKKTPEELQKLQNRKNNIKQKLRELLNVEEQTEKLLLNKNEKDEQLKELEEELKALEDKLQNENKEKLLLEEKLKVADLEYKNSLLEEHIKVLRGNLLENQPCPVCGSVHHPDAHKPLTSNAKYLEKKLNDAQKNLEQWSEKLEKTREELAKKQVLVQSIKEQLNIFKDQLNELLTNKKQISTELNLKFSDANQIKQAIDSLEKEIEQTSRQILVLGRISQLENNLTILQTIQNNIQKALNIRKELYDGLELYKNYFSGKKTTASQAIEILSDYYTKYKQAQEKLKDAENSIDKNKDKLKYLELRQTEVEQQIKELEKELNALKVEFDKNLFERKSLLGDEKPEDYERRLNNEISQAKDLFSKYISEFATVVTRIEQVDKQKQEFLTEKEHNQQEQQQLEQVLIPFVNELGYNFIEEALDDWLQPDEVQRLEDKKLSLEKQLAAIVQTIDDLKKELSQLIENDDKAQTLESINKTLVNIEQELKNINRTIGEVDQKLKADAQNREKVKSLRDQITQMQDDYEIWNTLSKLIGSRDGDKFVRIALEISLRELMRIANVYLQRFTDRYEVFVKALEINGKRSTEIFVRDLYRGANERSVRTLSGGETFLVSLSLALALAQMASKNITINSLFIDEGFGTLDQETLDTAINALQKLHEGTDRKIGIISHVEALKERIGVKISVERQTSGYSTVKIIS